jgi:hypothetical protein
MILGRQADHRASAAAPSNANFAADRVQPMAQEFSLVLLSLVLLRQNCKNSVVKHCLNDLTDLTGLNGLNRTVSLNLILFLILNFKLF